MRLGMVGTAAVSIRKNTWDVSISKVCTTRVSVQMVRDFRVPDSSRVHRASHRQGMPSERSDWL